MRWTTPSIPLLKTRIELEVQVDAEVIRANVARAASVLFERVYLWFEVLVEKIPYITGIGNAKVIDVDILRRGGKGQSY
jgi:hypothetical protein